MFTVRHSDSKERPNWRCTGISQLSSLQRDSAVTCRREEGQLSLGLRAAVEGTGHEDLGSVPGGRQETEEKPKDAGNGKRWAALLWK